MTFVKGHPQYGGKTKGTPNKDKREIVAKIQALWDGYSADQMLNDLSKLSEGERLKIMLGVAAEYLTPKLARSENITKISLATADETFKIFGKEIRLNGTQPLKLEE